MWFQAGHPLPYLVAALVGGLLQWFRECAGVDVCRGPSCPRAEATRNGVPPADARYGVIIVSRARYRLDADQFLGQPELSGRAPEPDEGSVLDLANALLRDR